MRAPLEEQRALLELQRVDTTIDRLDHRRVSLPEERKLSELRTQTEAIAQLAAERDGTLVTVRREQERLEHDIDAISRKATAEEARAAAGRVNNPKELTAIAAEVDALRRRVTSLEDDLLERMETRETLERELTELAERRAVADGETAEVTVARDAALAEIDRELATERAARAAVVPQVGAPLLALYEKIREREGGVGAAALVGNVCQGCRVTTSPVELRKLHDLPPDEVKRCDNCRRILVFG
jgi:predicted  nucleic acid-binding Zn-ribbon protein